ncbi:MAG TPA: hypothetical protein VIU15_45105, partial [Streptomyces sp.]
AFRHTVAPFDTLRGLLIGYHLACAVTQCHASGLVLADLGADNVYVLRRTIMLGDLSDCAVDGHHLGAGPVPTAADNIRQLGGLLQLISTKAGLHVPGLPEGMHLWQGDTWEPLRKLVLRCQETDPGLRPAASEIADTLARYVAQHRSAGAQALTAGRGDALARVPLAVPPETPGRLPLRLPRLGPGRREAEARLERVRVTLRYSRRLTLIGADPYSGRATTTVTLGSVLAAVRGEPVLALDGAPSEGALGWFLTERNPATVRDLAALRTGPAYADVCAVTTRLTTGLQVVAHRPGRYTPNPSHPQEYTRVLEHTAPYYPFVLTDWSPRVLGWSADVVLRHTDRLVLCCSSQDRSLDGARRVLGALRENGHQHLADEAVLVTTHLDNSLRTRLSQSFARELGIAPGRAVQVPFDNALRSPHWAPDRLRASTTRAFLDLAELVVASP